MTGKGGQRQLNNQLCRSGRPLAFAFDRLQTFQETTGIDQNAGKFRINACDGALKAPTRRQGGLCQVGAAAAARPPPGTDRCRPVGGNRWLQPATFEIRPKPFGGGNLERLQQLLSGPVAAPRQLADRAFIAVDQDRRLAPAAGGNDDFNLAMLGLERHLLRFPADQPRPGDSPGAINGSAVRLQQSAGQQVRHGGRPDLARTRGF